MSICLRVLLVISLGLGAKVSFAEDVFLLGRAMERCAVTENLGDIEFGRGGVGLYEQAEMAGANVVFDIRESAARSHLVASAGTLTCDGRALPVKDYCGTSDLYAISKVYDYCRRNERATGGITHAACMSELKPFYAMSSGCLKILNNP
jgi:hypothetical protein